jgi:hypothetical protein
VEAGIKGKRGCGHHGVGGVGKGKLKESRFGRQRVRREWGWGWVDKSLDSVGREERNRLRGTIPEEGHEERR